MNKPEEAKASADEIKILQGALAWAKTSLAKGYAEDADATEKSIHAKIEARSMAIPPPAGLCQPNGG